MDFNFDECRAVLHRALMGALSEKREEIRELHKLEPLWALSYDVLPWDPYIGLAFRLASESGSRASLNSGDWKHSHFIGESNTESLCEARVYTHRAYSSTSDDDGKQCREVAHLIFLAAAVALLDESVATLLQTLGIDAPIIGDSLPWNYFKFIVIDADGTIKANYCDIVCSNRVTRRLLGRVE